MSLLERAIAIALEAHGDQTDRTGKPYILHPLHLMMQMDDEVEMMVAVLHDVVEDSERTAGDLRREGFPTEVVEAVALLTHEEGVAYDDYVQRIKPHPLARKVKMADLMHNMDVRRIAKIQDNDLERLKKYHRAWKILTE